MIAPGRGPAPERAARVRKRLPGPAPEAFGSGRARERRRGGQLLERPRLGSSERWSRSRRIVCATITDMKRGGRCRSGGCRHPQAMAFRSESAGRMPAASSTGTVAVRAASLSTRRYDAGEAPSGHRRAACNRSLSICPRTRLRADARRSAHEKNTSTDAGGFGGDGGEIRAVLIRRHAQACRGGGRRHRPASRSRHGESEAAYCRSVRPMVRQWSLTRSRPRRHRAARPAVASGARSGPGRKSSRGPPPSGPRLVP